MTRPDSLFDNSLFDYSALSSLLQGTLLEPLSEKIPADLGASVRHGDFAGWSEVLKQLPKLGPESVELQQTLRIGTKRQLDDAAREILAQLLMQLHPWRKGPIELFGLLIDTEWRSDWKWERLLPHISVLQGRKVLDVGCGNGYHCWRMAGAGAALALGVDPHLLYTVQYWALRHFVPEPPVYVLPLALEDLPDGMQGFDTVFSMGVLYHRRSPFDHLISLRQHLRPGGELVLETLVTEGVEGMTLVPPERYARMPNVWFIPTSNTLAAWLGKSGYTNIRLVDQNLTSIHEQRSTSWMTFESLPQSLNPENPSLTVEGHPAPLRAVFIAQKPW